MPTSKHLKMGHTWNLIPGEWPLLLFSNFAGYVSEQNFWQLVQPQKSYSGSICCCWKEAVGSMLSPFAILAVPKQVQSFPSVSWVTCIINILMNNSQPIALNLPPAPAHMTHDVHIRWHQWLPMHSMYPPPFSPAQMSISECKEAMGMKLS